MRLKAGLARGLADLVRRAPRGATEPLAWGLGALLLLTHDRRVALENLARVWPAWSRTRRWRMAYAAYRQMARAVIEFLHTRAYSEAEIRQRVAIENEPDLRAAFATGRGVILLSGHFGNWEWLGRRVAADGYPFAVLYKEPRDPGLAVRLRKTREAAGLRQIDHDDMRAALRWVREGKVLGIIMDQEPRRSRDGVVVPLFGHPAMTHAGPFRLSRRTGAPVLTVFIRRVGRGRYRARFDRLPPSPSADPETAVAEEAAEFNARLEAAVREAPDHWLWMYRRWGRLTRRRESEEPAPAPPR